MQLRHRRSSVLTSLFLALPALAAAQNNFPTLPGTADRSSAVSSAATSAARATSASVPASASASASASAPATSDAITAAYSGFTDAPTLAGVGVPSLIVPDTSAAPFQQRSTLPEGTVFIAVASILAFIGVAILAWRAWVAWSLRQSVDRSARAKYAADIKRSSGFPVYSDLTTAGGETEGVSMEPLGGVHRRDDSRGRRSSGYDLYDPAARRSSKVPREKRTPTASALFFSPTAGAGVGLDTTATGSSRTSRYLPAGYYASSATTGSGGVQSSVTSVLGGPGAAGYGRLEHSPPGSPGRQQDHQQQQQRQQNQQRRQHQQQQRRESTGGDLGMTTTTAMATSGGGGKARHDRRGSSQGGDGRRRERSRSRLNISETQEAKERAPSQFLEDMFEHSGRMM